MEVQKEWLNFLRDQYQADSRIRLSERMDAPHFMEPGSMGTLEQIDDAGQFHVKWDDGRTSTLVIGVDRFQVLPPDVHELTFYMPLTAELFGYDDWGDLEEYGCSLDGQNLCEYEIYIREALLKSRMPEEAQRGLMHWYDVSDAVNQKVQSVVFDVEFRNDQLWGVAQCQVLGSLLPVEKELLAEYIAGQASDGWGEGFEQRPIRLNDGELYVSLWNAHNWNIQTEQEKFSVDSPNHLPDLCWSTLPDEGTLIYIERGKDGYSLSSWNTDSPEQNRRIADYNNQKRGITPKQEQAMLTGGMYGWEVPDAEPQEEYHEQELGGITFG